LSIAVLFFLARVIQQIKIVKGI